MLGKKNFTITLPSLVLLIAFNSFAEMSSDNYRIRNSVQSGGGTPTGSVNYHLNGTIGQPSPLMDSLEPPLSDNYDLYPGFWYLISAFESTCPGDSNRDKDVDGKDLAKYSFDPGDPSLKVFAANFGKKNCP